MIKKTLILLVLLFASGGAFFLGRSQDRPFETLTSQEMYDRIKSERDLAIQKAVEGGVYQCCINPPCTMCYMEANQWNNFKAGTCACDDLIVQGKEPCPQCERGLCKINKEGECSN